VKANRREENMIKMAIAMGVTNPTSGKDFIQPLIN
jgi:hypothetical protein